MLELPRWKRGLLCWGWKGLMAWAPLPHPVKFLDYRSLPQRLSMESLGWSGE